MGLNELSVGSSLETVLLGGLHGDALRIWRHGGEAEFRHVEPVEVGTSLLGRGVLARTSPEPNRFREVGLLDAASNTLLLTRRTYLRPGTDQITTEAARIQTRIGLAPRPNQAMWTEWGVWLGHVVGAAASRGEYVVVETGTWDTVPEPYVLMGVFPGPAGAWISHVEAGPTPAGEPWGTTGDGKPGTPVSAPATPDTVGVAGLLAVHAIGMWAVTSLDVVLTFGRSPGGPWLPAAISDD